VTQIIPNIAKQTPLVSWHEVAQILANDSNSITKSILHTVVEWNARILVDNEWRRGGIIIYNHLRNSRTL
jgi:hypothetical protein